MQKGSYFGEVAMLCPNSKRTATIRAGSNCDIYVLAIDAFRSVLLDFPEAAEAIEDAFLEVIENYKGADVKRMKAFLKELKFGVGDGFLQYYLYNWKCPKLEPSGTGLVLL